MPMLLFELFVPPRVRHDARLAARIVGVAKTLFAISGIVAALLAAFLLIRSKPSTEELVLFGAAILTPAMGAVALRLFGQITAVLMVVNVLGVAYVATWSYLTGGVLSAAVPWFLALLAALGTFGNLRVFAITATAHVVALLLLYLGTSRGIAPQSLVPDQDALYLVLLGLLSAVCMISVAAVTMMRERAGVKARMRESADRFRVLTELSSDWYWEQDADFRFINVGGEGQGSTCFKDVVGRTLWEMPHAGVSEESWGRFRETLEAHRRFNDFEWQCLDQGGRFRWMSISGVPVFDARGRFRGYRGTARNIHARVEGVLELSEAKRKLEVALEGSGSCIWDARGNGEVYLSPDWMEMLGETPRATHTTLDDLLAATHPDDTEQVRRAINRVLRGETDRYEQEHRVRDSRGSWRWILSRGRVVERGPDGRVERMSGTNTDITALHQAREAVLASERRYRELSESLDCRVAERTRELRELAARLGESEGRLSNAIDAVPTLIFCKDRDGVFLMCNRAKASLYGKTPDQMVGLTARQAGLPGAGADVLDSLTQRTRETGLIQVLQDHLVFDAAGREQVFHVTCIPFFHSKEHPDAVLGVSVNITSLKENQSSLLHSISVLNSVLDSVEEGVLALGNDSKPISWNRKFLEMLGVSEESLRTGDVDAARVQFEANLEDPVQFRSWVARLEHDRSYSGTRELLLLDGRVLERFTQPIMNGGNGEGRVYSYRDITARKRHENVLREAEVRLRQVIDLVPHRIFAHDRAGRHVLANRAHALWLASTPDALLGRTQYESGLTLAAARFADAADARVRSSGVMDFVEDEFVGRNTGELRHYSTWRVPFRYSDDVPDAVLGVSVDVTDLRSAQEEARELNRSLEERVLERTAELAEAMNELESFSYSVSHDLRTPVRAVTGFSGVLLEDHGADLPIGARRLVERIASAGQSMNDMIDGLLDLSRIGRRELTRRSTDLSLLAREVWEELVLVAPERRVLFEAREGLSAACDPVLVRNLLQNLLGNAFKYTRDTADARVEIGCEVRVDESVFFVRDNGTGFDMAYARHLFGVFQRLHGREFEGTGIGLATAQRIVQRHGGRIWAESSPGNGAMFHFTLPA